jgi:hypothetical protein
MQSTPLTLAVTSLLFLSVSSWTFRPTNVNVRQHHQRRQYANRITTPHSSSLLHQSAASDQSVDTKNLRKKTRAQRYLDLPWSDLQQWALVDKYPKYTVQLPTTTDPDGYEIISGETTMKAYTLWRTMCEEVDELTGYPIPFLQEQLRNNNNNNNNNGDTVTSADGAPPANTVVMPSSEILPFLDEFEFESEGGLSGRVYGIQGVADGTRIQTTPVGNVQVTVPRGFVRTADGSVIYELGRPRSDVAATDDSSSSFSLSGFSSGSARSKALQKVQEEASNWAGSLSNVQSDLTAANDGDVDKDLIRLGGITALVLGGALAVDLLSHHLTISVFMV